MKKYTCPMHIEVISDRPDNCSKCGMKLVLQDKINISTTQVDHMGLGPISWKSYLPLLIIIAVIAVSALISADNSKDFVENFMIGFFIVFASFKLIDLPGFARGYYTYDLIAQRFMAYGYIYPFIELSFGLMMLAGFMPISLLWMEFGIMAFSGLGVAIKIAKKEEFQCVCLGTFLKVPLTKITLIEDFGMAGLALLLILLG